MWIHLHIIMTYGILLAYHILKKNYKLTPPGSPKPPACCAALLAAARRSLLFWETTEASSWGMKQKPSHSDIWMFPKIVVPPNHPI